MQCHSQPRMRIGATCTIEVNIWCDDDGGYVNTATDRMYPVRRQSCRLTVEKNCTASLLGTQALLMGQKLGAAQVQRPNQAHNH
mmetsp:Transcript_70023/g.97348  ORF Transcript_70023/g.97348 Transcript_70023/m.97348 type:complete len:84 (+) Transcript_70023:413-664(+)